MMRRLVLVMLLLTAAFVPRPSGTAALKVASKKFTESVILGEMCRLLAEHGGQPTSHLPELGGTRIVFEALKNGDVDAYVEYSGTLINELFAEQRIATIHDLRNALAQDGIRMSEPLGFNNTYALAMRTDHATAKKIDTMSDLSRSPDLKYGLSSEFLERADGWPGLKTAYSLSPNSVTGLDHDIAYRQLQLGIIDVLDVYTTEARIDAFDLTVLKDDQNYFPRYDAVILYREDSAQEFDAAFAQMLRLEGQISERQMTACNRRAEIDGVSEQQVAADFVARQFDVAVTATEPTRSERIIEHTLNHLELVRRSLLPAILLAIPLGIVAARRRWLGHLVLGTSGIFQTIPSFALLVLLLPLVSMTGLQSVGVGSLTAVIALFLYSLLPIIRNTHAGLLNIDRSLLESAEVLNLPATYRLLEIELPLARPAILAGIKTAAVMNIGFATLGALVGAGGYGQPILSGIRRADTSLILEGAVPAALLAIVVQLAFEFFEQRHIAKTSGERTTSPEDRTKPSADSPG